MSDVAAAITPEEWRRRYKAKFLRRFSPADREDVDLIKTADHCAEAAYADDPTEDPEDSADAEADEWHD